MSAVLTSRRRRSARRSLPRGAGSLRLSTATKSEPLLEFARIGRDPAVSISPSRRAPLYDLNAAVALKAPRPLVHESLSGSPANGTRHRSGSHRRARSGSCSGRDAQLRLGARSAPVLARRSGSSVVRASARRQILLLARGEGGASSRDLDVIESRPQGEADRGRPALAQAQRAAVSARAASWCSPCSEAAV